jgi:hypothetical protein
LAFSGCSSLSSHSWPAWLQNRLKEYRSLLKEPTVEAVAEGDAVVSARDEVEVEGDTVNRGNTD